MDNFMNYEKDYVQNCSLIKTNIEKNINNLKFVEKFNKQGKQGVVGILEDNNNYKIVYKISQYLNFLVMHEYSIMKSLSELFPYCPHFCKPITKFNNKVDPKYRKMKNPFEIKSKHPILVDTLLMERSEEHHV